MTCARLCLYVPLGTIPFACHTEACPAAAAAAGAAPCTCRLGHMSRAPTGHWTVQVRCPQPRLRDVPSLRYSLRQVAPDLPPAEQDRVRAQYRDLVLRECGAGGAAAPPYEGLPGPAGRLLHHVCTGLPLLPPADGLWLLLHCCAFLFPVAEGADADWRQFYRGPEQPLLPMLFKTRLCSEQVCGGLCWGCPLSDGEALLVFARCLWGAKGACTGGQALRAEFARVLQYHPNMNSVQK